MNIELKLVRSSWILIWITMHIKVFIKGDGKQVRTLSNFGFRRRNARNSLLAVEQWTRYSPLQDFWRDHGSWFCIISIIYC